MPSLVERMLFVLKMDLVRFHVVVQVDILVMERLALLSIIVKPRIHVIFMRLVLTLDLDNKLVLAIQALLVMVLHVLKLMAVTVIHVLHMRYVVELVQVHTLVHARLGIKVMEKVVQR